MNTRPDSDMDTELLAIVRSADPMLHSRAQTDGELDTESALRGLAHALDRTPAPPRARPRRRTAWRAAMLAGAIAAVVFAATNVASTGNGSGVSQAQAQTILRHIRDALKWPSAAIYEEDDKTTITARDGATFTWETHEWLSTSRPHNMRLIMIANGRVQFEQASVGGRLDIYAPSTNTVYLAPAVSSRQGTDAPQWNSALSMVQYLLREPDTDIDSHATLEGKRAIELTFDRGRFSYWISPRTYQPLQSLDREDSLPDGRGGVGITRYRIARVLTGSAAPNSLLSLQAHHPGAAVDHSSTDYAAILARLQNVGTGVL